jgi:uncharacterized membrane protein YdjX (TVP38/TMEM64 family)
MENPPREEIPGEPLVNPPDPTPEKPQISPRASTRSVILRILAIAMVIILTVTLFLLRDKVQDLGVYGYPGIFLISIIANSTVILPLPGVMITSAMGAVFNPFWVAVAAGTGAAIGELSGYLAGFGGQAIIKETERYQKLTNWMRKYGDWTILVLAFVPNPAFDMAGIIAGALKLPVYRFLLWCCLGKILKMLIFSYLGAGFLGIFSP